MEPEVKIAETLQRFAVALDQTIDAPFHTGPIVGGTRSVGAVVFAPAFRTEFTRLFQVPYIRVGGLVLVRIWDWLDDPYDWLINASKQRVSIRSLIQPCSLPFLMRTTAPTVCSHSASDR